MNTSERLIRGLKGWGGRIANAFSSAPESSGTMYPSYMPKEAVQARDRLQPTQSMVGSGETEIAKKSDFDQEVDKQLDQISNVLGGIHARSLEISESISRQVKTVEAVDRSIDKSNDRIRRQHEDIKGLR